jgi:PEGA domain
MEYPGSKLTKPFRFAILIFVVAVFCLLAPILIMYTSGYRYDWQRGLLRETGAINIDIEPKQALVSVNNIEVATKMPVRLNDRVPGKYQIQITAPGYFDWQKDVDVKNKQTIYIKKISMLRTNQPSIVVEGQLSGLVLSNDGQYASYVRKFGKTNEVRLLNLRNNTDALLTTFPEGKTPAVLWAKNHNYFAVSESATPYQTLAIFKADDPTNKIDLMALTKSPINRYEWKETAEPELYYSTDLRLMSFVPNTSQRYVLGKNIWLDWHMDNGQLWTLQTATGTKQIQLVRDTLGFSETFAAENIFTPGEQELTILGSRNSTVLLKKNGKPEMILLADGQKYNLAGEQFRISEYNNWWLIWTPWEIWTYTQNEEPNLLNRSGESLQNVIPLDQYNTLALVWKDKTTALYPYYLVTHDLINNILTSADVDTKTKTLYFTGKIGEVEGLWKLGY